MKLNKKFVLYLGIIVCIFCIGFFLYNIFCVDYEEFTIKTVFASLIIGLITTIGLFLSIISNIETKEYNNYLIEENIKTRFIQLRFDDSKWAINYLIRFLEKTLSIYSQINAISNEKKHQYITPYEFLLVQYINILADFNLIYNLPNYVTNKLENVVNGYEDYENPTNAIFVEFYQKIQNKNICELILSHYQYIDFINKFSSYEKFNDNFNTFIYFFDLNLSEQEILNCFNEILLELKSKSIEELILMDKDYFYE